MDTIQGYNYPAGIAYVALPTDLDRSRYIALCYKTRTVCVRMDDGAFFTRVPIADRELQEIEFPEDSTKMGSPVVYVTEPVKNQIFIISTFQFPEDLPDLKEGQFKLRRRFLDSYVEISGSAKEKRVSVIVNTETGGEATFNILSKDNTGKLKLDVQGDIEIVVTKNTKLLAGESTNIATQNDQDKSSFNQTPTNNEFINKKFTINKGDEAMIRGTAFKSFMDDLIIELSNSTVTTSIGQQPLLNKAQIAAFKEKTQELLSTIAFLE